ncbi:MAG: S8 family peptidase [Eubacteriales bacterium]
MNSSINNQDFINSPDTVDFIIRQGEFLTSYITENPDIVFSDVLIGGFFVAYANKNIFQNIIRNFRTSVINSFAVVLTTLDRVNLEASGITQMHQQPFYNLDGRGVLVGIVDTGIDYTQDVFKRDDGTSKIQYIYDQSISSIPPQGFYIGTEYTNAQINDALNSEDPYEVVPQKDTSGHGTFLASIAAGSETNEFIGAAPEAELIVVKLKKARPYYLDYFSIPEDQENVFESTDIMLGVEYIIDKARQLGRPVSICIGLGTDFGSHDGFSLFEEYLSVVSRLKGVCLCTAAGNENLARHHMQGLISAQGNTANIDLQIGDNASNIFLSVWNDVSDRFSVSVRSPMGELLGRFPAIPGKINETDLILERTRVNIVYYFPMEGNGNQLTVIRFNDVTPGIWTITVYGDIIVNGSFNAWLPITGFISPNVYFLAPTPYNTITVPGTMIGGICSGAYDSSNNTLYAHSSWGPSLAPFISPDFVAPGVNIGGFVPGGYATMSGTSVATAITTGAGALLLQWGIVDGNDDSLSTNQIRAYLIRGCNRSETIVYPNPKWGYGTLNVVNSFELMRGGGIDL